MAKGVPQADGSTRVEPLMDVNHVASAVVHMANLPLETNVQFMIMATKMPFIGRGWRACPRVAAHSSSDAVSQAGGTHERVGAVHGRPLTPANWVPPSTRST